ncbi:hypothetical protein SKAU_G00298640, partial [Synaphobranchus kaupii]
LTHASLSLSTHYALVSKPARLSPPSPWLTDSLRSSRTMLRAAERKWRKSRSPDELASYHTLLAAFTAATTSAKTSFFQSKIDTCLSNPRKLFSTFSSLNQLSVFLHQNNLLDPHQSGFRTGHSTETALLAVTEALATARASSLSSVLILLDLSAAFDTVNHKLLISTLAEMGISGTALSWLRRGYLLV